MKRFVFLFVVLVLAVFLFFYVTGKFSLGTEAQETLNPVEDTEEDDSQMDDNSIEGEPDPSDDAEIQEEEEVVETEDPQDNTDMDTDVEEELEIKSPIKGAEEFYKDVIVVDKPDDIKVLVNKKNVLKSDYEPSDLVKPEVFAPGRSEIEMFMREEVATSILELVNAAEAEADLEILPASAYRSYELQTIIFQNNVNKKGSVEKANETSALPGQSEHQTGLAVDMSCSSIGYKINNSFADTEEALWLADNAHRFGFIIRYPKGKTDITGYSYEPWHLRYVGEDTALSIFEDGITFEEYLSE